MITLLPMFTMSLSVLRVGSTLFGAASGFWGAGPAGVDCGGRTASSLFHICESPSRLFPNCVAGEDEPTEELGGRLGQYMGRPKACLPPVCLRLSGDATIEERAHLS